VLFTYELGIRNKELGINGNGTAMWNEELEFTTFFPHSSFQIPACPGWVYDNIL